MVHNFSRSDSDTMPDPVDRKVRTARGSDCIENGPYLDKLAKSLS